MQYKIQIINSLKTPIHSVPNWGSCTKIQNTKPPSFPPKRNPRSKSILKNLIPNSEEKTTHSEQNYFRNLIPKTLKKKPTAKLFWKILCPKPRSQNLDIPKSTPKVKNSKFKIQNVLCQIVVAVLYKDPKSQTFPETNRASKFLGADPRPLYRQ